MTDELNIRLTLRDWGRRAVQLIPWISRAAIIIVLLYAVLERVQSPIAHWIGVALGFPEPSLVSLVSSVAILFMLERVVTIESLLEEKSIAGYATRVEAYDKFVELARDRRIRKMDLLQFSGHTAMPVLRAIVNAAPRARFRLLLCHPDTARLFDADGKADHLAKTATTINTIIDMKEDFAQKEIQLSVDVFYYKTPPVVASILIDDNLVSLGWHRSFVQENVVRMRGHSSAGINAYGTAAADLCAFTADHFNLVLKTAELVESSRRVSADRLR